MTRHVWVLLHRYAGLYMAFFLMVAGLTGSVLAFYHELDAWLNPNRYRVALPAQPLLDGFTLRQKALLLEPRAYVNDVNLHLQPGHVYEAFLQPRIDPKTGKPYELGFHSLRLNPYTGTLIGVGRDEPTWPLTRRTTLARSVR